MTQDSSLTRNQILDLRSDLDRLWPTAKCLGEATLVKTAAKNDYPADAAAYFWCELIRASGTPSEGEPGVFTPSGRHLFALNLGSQIPPAGTILLAVLAGSRWTIRYDG